MAEALGVHPAEARAAAASPGQILAEKPGLFMAVYYKALLMARAGDNQGAWGLAQTLPGDFLDGDQGMAAMVAQMALASGDTETGASMLARMLKNHPDAIAVRIRLAQLRLQQDSTSSALSDGRVRRASHTVSVPDSPGIIRSTTIKSQGSSRSSMANAA